MQEQFGEKNEGWEKLPKAGPALGTTRLILSHTENPWAPTTFQSSWAGRRGKVLTTWVPESKVDP